MLACPHCTAPLAMTSLARAHGNVLACVWCASLVRLEGNTVTVEKVVADDAGARIRQLVIDGKLADAQAAATEAGLPATFIAETTEQLVRRTLAFQTLNALGFAFVFAWVAVIGASAYAATNVHAAAWAGVALGAFGLLGLAGPLVVTARAAFAARATATFKQVKPLGVRALRGGKKVHVMASTIEVTPADGSARFDATFLAAVREQSVPKVVPGARIEVRYSKADPTFVRFHAWPV